MLLIEDYDKCNYNLNNINNNTEKGKDNNIQKTFNKNSDKSVINLIKKFFKNK